MRQGLAVLAFALCAIIFSIAACSARATLLEDPAKVAALSQGDAAHYLAIASDFAAGDVSMEYVRTRGHRQPLYPAALAVGAAVVGHDPRQLLLINIGIMTATVFLVGLLCWRLFDSVLAGLTASVLLAGSAYVMREGALRLLTEPLYTLCVVGALACLLRYFRTARQIDALAASGLLGLAYLTRPTGLFLFVAAAIVMTLADWRQWRTVALSLGAFLLVTIPSWLPRLSYKGHPFYHGYLPNFVWADSYAAAHVPGDPRFTFADYTTSHTVADAWHRLTYGLDAVFLDAPLRTLSRAGIAVIVIGLLLVLLTRRREMLLLAAVFVIHVLPFAWTHLSLPVFRYAANGIVAFGLFYAAFVGSTAEGWLVRLAPRLRGVVDRRRRRPA